jgi:hypothetical protein
MISKIFRLISDLISLFHILMSMEKNTPVNTGIVYPGLFCIFSGTHIFVLFREQHQACVAMGGWDRLVFETRGGSELVARW